MRYFITRHEGVLYPQNYGPFDTKEEAIAWAFNRFGPAGGSIASGRWAWQPHALRGPEGEDE